MFTIFFSQGSVDYSIAEAILASVPVTLQAHGKIARSIVACFAAEEVVKCEVQKRQ